MKIKGFKVTRISKQNEGSEDRLPQNSSFSTIFLELITDIGLGVFKGNFRFCCQSTTLDYESVLGIYLVLNNLM